MFGFAVLVLFLLYSFVNTHHHHHHHYHHNKFHGDEAVSSEADPRDDTAVPYGPSIIALTRYNHQVHGPTIFHPDTGRFIHLEDYPGYSVVVPLASDSESASSNHVFVSRRLSGPGEFQVVAPEGHGVMAVIQTLDLRTAPNGCNDFIQFGEVESGVETTGTCGKVDKGDGSFAPSSLTGPRVFLSPAGKMRVLFYHGFVWGLVRDFNFDLMDPSRNPMLKVEIVFTAYKECEPDFNLTHSQYRSCTIGSATSFGIGRKTCIPAELFCDKILNCAFEEDFGYDEYLGTCLPSLVNLLLPKVLPAVKEREYSWPFNILQSVVPQTTTPRTPTNLPVLQLAPTSPVTSPAYIPRSFVAPPSTTPSSATTKKWVISLPTKAAPTSSLSLLPTQGLEEPPKRTQLREHVIKVARTRLSPVIVVTSATTKTTTPTTPKPTPSVRINITTISRSSDNQDKVVLLPLEFEETVQLPQLVGNISLNSNNPTQPAINMTLSPINNVLYAEQGEAKIDQLQNGPISSEAGENPESNASSTLWIILVLCLFIAGVLILRMYCHKRAIWIPNPASLRTRRKKRETSLYARNLHGHPVIPHLQECPNSTGKRFSSPPINKEVPLPSYDSLFPKPILYNSDVLP